MKTFLKCMAITACIVYTTLPAVAQNSSADEEAAYTRAINQRAEKIVKTLSLADAETEASVQQLIAGQYRNLRDVHDTRDAQIKAVKQKADAGKKADKQLANIEKDTEKKLDKLHARYLAALNEKLTAEQVDMVKDGMTYSVAPNTYRVYLDMLPSLTEEQKKQIHDWLVEAREHAMDAGTSEKKHWWFGKYKGKINNYLSAAGYDMKQAEADWKKRKETAGKS